jgi:hypothetical protein
MKTKRTISHTQDHDGAAVVMVPLANHPFPAKLLASDYDALTALGVTDQWTYNPNGRGDRFYIRCGADCRGKLLSPARVLMNAQAGEVVKYHDGDGLNLRRDNLYFASGKALRSDAALARKDQEHRETKLRTEAHPTQAAIAISL